MHDLFVYFHASQGPLSSEKRPLTWANVGVAGFEPTTSSSRTKRAAKLRYTPRLQVVFQRLRLVESSGR